MHQFRLVREDEDKDDESHESTIDVIRREWEEQTGGHTVVVPIALLFIVIAILVELLAS